MSRSISDQQGRDHGGNLDAARARFGGVRQDWVDLSTGINPVPYPVGDLDLADWTALPDTSARQALITAARAFWRVPEGAEVLAAPGASALIAQMPRLAAGDRVEITPPTYNEHAASFEAAGWKVVNEQRADARVLVHPNNPDGRFFEPSDFGDGLTIIDESFCDVLPERSHIAHASNPKCIVIKSFGKFWGLAGLRLGFAIGHPDTIGALQTMLGPWAVSGPALKLGTAALQDADWADQTRERLNKDRARLDGLMQSADASILGGTSLFGLYEVDDAKAWQTRLARSHIWTRIFPYSDRLLRLGMPHPDRWAQLEAAL